MENCKGSELLTPNRRHVTYGLADPLHDASRFTPTALIGLVVASVVICSLYFSIYPFGPLLAWFGCASVAALLAKHRQDRRLGITSAVMFLAGVLAIPSFVMHGHSVSPHRLERIRVGSLAADVESAIGSPSSVMHDTTGDDWLYSGPTWCHVTVSFDPNGIVDCIDHDH